MDDNRRIARLRLLRLLDQRVNGSESRAAQTAARIRRRKARNTRRHASKHGAAAADDPDGADEALSTGAS